MGLGSLSFMGLSSLSFMGHSGPGFSQAHPVSYLLHWNPLFGWRGQDSAALAISQAPPVDGLCVSICPLALGHVQDRAWIRPVFCSLPSVAREELRLPFERASSSWNTGIRLPTRGEVPSFEAVPPSLFSRKQHPASALSPPFGGSSFRWVGGSRTPFPPGGGICRWAVLPLRGRRRPALFGVVFLFSPAPSRGGLGTYGFPGLYGPRCSALWGWPMGSHSRDSGSYLLSQEGAASFNPFPYGVQGWEGVAGVV